MPGDYIAMPYRIRHRERLDHAFRRIVNEQVEHLLTALPDAALDSPLNDVHKARKHCKKLRALLRLYRQALGDARGALNAQFREAARLLAPARDADAMDACIATLAERCPDLTPSTCADAHARVHARRQDLASAGGKNQQAAEAVRCAENARREALALNLPEDDVSMLLQGLKNSYRKGRKAYRTARDTPSDTAFHEWRKCVKDHLYHVRLLAAAWPTMMACRQEQLQALSDMLGEDHDLAVLRHGLAEPGNHNDAQDAAPLRHCAARRQETLRQAAKQLGKKLYADTPTQCCRRIAALWNA